MRANTGSSPCCRRYAVGSDQVTRSTDVIERFVFFVHRGARNPTRRDFYEIQITIIRTVRLSCDEPFARGLDQFLNLTQSDLQQARRRMTIATYGGGRGRRAAVLPRPSGRTDRFRAGNRLSWFSSNSEVNLTRFSGSGPTLVV